MYVVSSVQPGYGRARREAGDDEAVGCSVSGAGSGTATGVRTSSSGTACAGLGSCGGPGSRASVSEVRASACAETLERIE